MSSNLERQLLEDRAMRDAARAVLDADMEHLKADFSAKSLAGRFADRVSDGALDIFEEASEAAESNRGILALLIAGIFIWFARNPLIALFLDEDYDLTEQAATDDYEQGEEPDDAG